MYFKAFAVFVLAFVLVLVLVNTIDVVLRVKGMSFPRPRRKLYCPPFKQHYRHINPTVAGGRDTGTQSAEVSRIKLLEIEFWLAVEGLAGSCSRPGLGSDSLEQNPAGLVLCSTSPTPTSTS